MSVKRSKKDVILWTPGKENVLVNSVFKHNAFTGKVGALTLDMKWKNVVVDLKVHTLFEDVPPEYLTYDAVKNKFKRLRKHVETKYALDGEGRTNLSGLPESPTAAEGLVMDMINIENNKTLEIQGEKEIKDKKKRMMLAFESEILSDTSNSQKSREPSPEPSPTDTFSSNIGTFFLAQEVNDQSAVIARTTGKTMSFDESILAARKVRAEAEKAREEREIEREKRREEREERQHEAMMERAERQEKLMMQFIEGMITALIYFASTQMS